MKTRQEEYAPWLLGQTVDEYCNASVMPLGSEIENVGLSALKDVLLSPAGITLEVLYLDRSEGNEVNMHRFSPLKIGYDIGTIRLLYRPGHYDLLYMPQDMPPAPVPAAVPTYLQYASHPYQEPAYDLGVSDFMTMIPGMSYANQHTGWISSSSYGDSDFYMNAAPVQPCAQVVPTPVDPVPQPQMQPQTVYMPTTQAHLVAPPLQMPQELAIRSVSHTGIPPHLDIHDQVTGRFRPSTYQIKPEIIQATSYMPFQTSIFRKYA